MDEWLLKCPYCKKEIILKQRIDVIKLRRVIKGKEGSLVATDGKGHKRVKH